MTDPNPESEIVSFAFLSLTGLVLTVRFVRAIPRSGSATRPHAEAETRL